MVLLVVDVLLAVTLDVPLLLSHHAELKVNSVSLSKHKRNVGLRVGVFLFLDFSILPNNAS